MIVAFGIASRVGYTAMEMLRQKGLKVGLFRPITLFPFPEKQIEALSVKQKNFLVVELNMGQMVEDVRLAVNGRSDVYFYGRAGGSMVTQDEIVRKVLDIYEAVSTRLSL